MDRHLVERWTDTTAFGVVLVFAGTLALPVLAVGVVVSIVMIAFALFEQTVEPFGTVIVVLSAGGAIGVIGWLRARRGISNPDGHNVTATIVCLVVGTATALAVGTFAAAPIVMYWRDPWGGPIEAWPAALFAAAHAVWVLAGIGWMQRLARRHAEHTGRAFDGISLVFLFVAIVLVATATLATLLS